MQYRIGDAYIGTNVKTYLHRTLGLSGAQVTALKKRPDGILVNGAHVTVRYELKPGDILSLATEDDISSENIVPTKLPLCILYEDDALMVLDKPPMMPTHPSHGHYTDTLANGLACYFMEKNMPFVFRSVSRLDRDTSGIVTVAKNRAAAHRFTKMHVNGEIRKEYIAVLCGTLTPKSGEISAAIRRQADSVITRIVTEDGDGAPALTRYRVLSYGSDGDGAPLTLVAAEPVTGRTHQLRVHFASRGCPILGDFLYGDETTPHIRRQALHCSKTAFIHPVSGRMMTVTAPLPADFHPLMRFFKPQDHKGVYT